MKHLTTAKQFSAVCTVSLFASIIIPTTAHAGWLNDMFTYREEQKPFVAPTVDLPPVEIISPYYNQQTAAKWSKYHTKPNMKPVPYIDGSSSLVMRQQTNKKHVDDNRKMKAWPGNLHVDKKTKTMPQGYEAILWRDYVNRLQNTRKKTFIGEPGFAQKLQNSRTASVGQKTMIGNPVNNWKDEPAKNNGATPRKGDFDYNKTSSNNYTTITQPTAPSKPTMETTRQGKMVMPNSLPNNYIVVEGDSLSGISQKDKIYGNWKMWPLIYDANRNQINDPDLIHPKQSLGIPRNYNNTESMNAKRRALDKKPPYSFYDGK